MVLRLGAAFEVARQVQSSEGAQLGDVFTFTSGLYFRGKIAYAKKFARPPPGLPGAFVIAPGRGLVRPEQRVTAAELIEMGKVPVDEGVRAYREPLERDARWLADAANDAEIVLLGSVASGKYTRILTSVFEDLLFPKDFVGRGDMSRGGLLLRCAKSGDELEYEKVKGAVLKGKRPPKLRPMRWK